MLVELGAVDQRVMEVQELLDGATVTDGAQCNGVTRPTGSASCFLDASSQAMILAHDASAIALARTVTK